MHYEAAAIVTRSIGLVVAAAIIVLTVAQGPVGARRHRMETGLGPIAFDRIAPNFALDATPGSARPTLAALRGRPVVLNFWAAYCEPCRAELDAFARLRAEYADSVTLVTVSDEQPDIVAATLRAKNVAAIAISDPERKIFALYGVSAIPVTLVLAPDEAVRYVSIGQLDWDELHAAVDAAASAPVHAAT